MVSHARGIFRATFLYALTALAWVDRGGSGRVQLSSLWIVGVLLLASIASISMFISLIHRIGVLQVNRMLILPVIRAEKSLPTFIRQLKCPPFGADVG